MFDFWYGDAAMTRLAPFKRGALALIVFSIFSGCFEDEGPHSDTDSGTDTEGEPPPVPGFLWCAEVAGAQANFVGSSPQTIVDPENANGSPKGCVCAAKDLHLALNNIAVGGQAVVNGGHSPELQDFRDEVFDAAEARCLQIISDDYPTSVTNTCLDELVVGVSGLESEAGDCAVEDRSNPTDGWADYYSLNSVIVYDPAVDLYEIDEAFFQDVLAHPKWLLADSASLGFNGMSYQFYGVSSGDIVAALGIQTNDIPISLNGLDVTTIEDAYAAHVELRDEDVFEFVVRRGLGSVTLTYVLVP